MTKNNKHIIPSLKQFLDYIHNRISSKKRNAFERNLQKDLFAAEAFEGLSMIDEKRVRDDIFELNKKILTKGNTKYNPYILSIAAAIALLVVTSVAYLAIERIIDSKEESRISYIETEKNAQFDSIFFLEEDLEISKEEIEKPDRKRESAKPKQEKTATSVVLKTLDYDIILEEIADSFFIVEDEEEIAESIENKVSGEAGFTPAPQSIVLADRSILEEEDKSSARKALSPAYEIRQDYSTPQPTDGMREFRKYLSKNAKMPESVDMKKATVELSFIVNTEGKPIDFEIINSPSDVLSELAIELIKNGPEWNPAKIDEKLVEEKVVLMILFKK